MPNPLVIRLYFLHLCQELRLSEESLLDQQNVHGIDLNGVGHQEFTEINEFLGVEFTGHVNNLQRLSDYELGGDLFIHTTIP